MKELSIMQCKYCGTKLNSSQDWRGACPQRSCRQKAHAEMYGITIGEEPKTKEKFLADLAAESTPFILNTVDVNMSIMSFGAAALKAGLNPDDEDIRAAVTQKLKLKGRRNPV
jgi:hypothetical protein